MISSFGGLDQIPEIWITDWVRILPTLFGNAYILQRRISYAMDARLLDVIIGLSAFLILIVLLAVMPMVMAPGMGYIAAILVFILFLSFAGYRVNEKIV